ncbi:MAG: class I tRNA ligase family protein, partial [Myxococcota bacterium]|nr:class I tRNA ligase family protein [Myxococcota bacterium]
RAFAPGEGSDEQARLLAQTIDGVTKDLDDGQPNTAISKLMVLSRDIAKSGPVPEKAAHALPLLLAPFAPHLAEELWQQLGHTTSLALEAWPEADASRLSVETLTLAVQVNGKRRAEIEVPVDADEDAIRALALAADNVSRHLEGKEPRRVIVVPGRLVNVVV